MKTIPMTMPMTHLDDKTPSHRRPAASGRNREPLVRRAAVLLAAVMAVAPTAMGQVPATAPSGARPASAGALAPTASATPAAPAVATTRPAVDAPAGNGTGNGAAPAPHLGSSSTAELVDDLSPDGKLHLLVGRSTVVKTRIPYKRVSVTHPDVLSDNEVDATGILLTGRKAGSTQIVLWDDRDRTQVVDVVIEIDLAAIEGQLKQMFPDTLIHATAANGSVVLKGRVPNLQVAEQVTDLMASYGKVLNFMEVAGGQQIMLKVRFAEVSRSASSALGFNTDINDGKSILGFQNGPGAASTGQLGKSITGTAVSPAVEIFGAGQIGHTAFEGFLEALRSNNLLRVLAEPDLVTSSGQEANFLAGGEFPIPIPQAGGSGAAAITVDYKQYGVRLSFVPVALGDGKIRLKVSPEVSDLDYTNSVSFNGFTIPSLTKRNLSTTIELKEGQTFAVAGLLNTRLNSTKSVTPLLGDIPVVGALFRSVRYQRSETELVVLVTPQLVEAMNPGQVPDLPGEHWQIPTENDLFLNAELGGPGAATVRHPASQELKPGPAQYYGPYGFTPVIR